MAINYQLKLGDCILCIIQNQGLLADTVWNHPNNALLAEKRGALYYLVPGDMIFLPDVRVKEVSEPTNQVHKFTFKAKDHLHWIEIDLIGEDNQPIPNEKYCVVLPDKHKVEGRLDKNGWARIETRKSGDCQVTFPDLDALAWDYEGAVNPKSDLR